MKNYFKDMKFIFRLIAKILNDWEYIQKAWITSLFQTVLKDEHLKYFGICSEFYLLYGIVHWMGFYFFGCL